MSNVSRWGRPAAIAAGVLWLIAWAYFTLDELQYQGEIIDNPIPGPVGLPALTFAALATAVALGAVRSRLQSDGAGTKVSFGIAYLGTAVSLIPVWPAIFLGPLLVLIGISAVGILAIRSEPHASVGHRIHAFGLAGAAIAAPLLDLTEVIDSSFGVAIFGAILAIGLIWIGVDLDATAEAPVHSAAAA